MLLILNKYYFYTIHCKFARCLIINQKNYEKIIFADVDSGHVDDRELQ